MERAHRAYVLTGVRRCLVACTRSPCTCLLQGGAAVCCPVETDSCRWPIHRPLWSETASRRSARKTKTDWRSASRLQAAGPQLLSGVIFTLIFPSFCDFFFLNPACPLSRDLSTVSQVHTAWCSWSLCRHGCEWQQPHWSQLWLQSPSGVQKVWEPDGKATKINVRRRVSKHGAYNRKQAVPTVQSWCTQQVK